MSQLDSDTSGGGLPSIAVLIRSLGLFLFLFSFFLRAVGGLKGWECALWALASSVPSQHDDKISSLSGAGLTWKCSYYSIFLTLARAPLFVVCLPS